MPRNLTQFAFTVPEGDFFVASFNTRVAISHDARYVALNAVHQGQDTLYLRSLSELKPRLAVEGGLGGIPFFAPDGQWLGFLQTVLAGTVGAGGALRKVGLGGGAPITICRSDSPAGATWAADGTIYFVSAMPGGVMRVPAAGGDPQEMVKIDFAHGERMHKYPHALPGGDAVLFTVATTDSESFDDAQIARLLASDRAQKSSRRRRYASSLFAVRSSALCTGR